MNDKQQYDNRQRIIAGAKYFYNRKPSEWTPKDTIFIKRFIEMVMLEIGETELLLEEK